ncbi:sulfatase [Fragilaria crotonensis]|nr:sulfatase [Fragilaria crotonensis]
MTDQQRYDAIRRVQDELLTYDGSSRSEPQTWIAFRKRGDKIDQLEGLDQILVEDHGYVSEYYGKWHVPSRLYDRRDGSSRAVDSNDYDYSTGAFSFEDVSGQVILRGYLEYFRDRGDISKTFADGQQEDSYSEYPYTPIALDSRYGLPTNTPLSGSNNFKSSGLSDGKLHIGQALFRIIFNHDVALRALNRLASHDTPFLLTISYHHPHPPFMAPFEYLSYYWDRRQDLFESPDGRWDRRNNIVYFTDGDQAMLEDAGYCDVEKVKEWTAVYYAMVERSIHSWASR